MVEKAFPRGRGDVRSTSDVKSDRKKQLVDKKRKDDVLFGGTSGHKPVQKKLKTTLLPDASSETAAGRSMLPVGGGGCSRSKHGNRIDPLSFQKLQPGMKLLAICRQVQDDIAIFSLPNLWTAYMMRKANNTLPFTVSLQVHQVMAVVIVKAVQETTPEGPRRRIQVTCWPETVNPMDYNVKDLMLRGIVKSVEDHGVLVDLGMNRTGFLAFADIGTDYTTTAVTNDDDEINDDTTTATIRLHEGRVLDFVVKEATSSKVVPLRIPKYMERVALPPGHKPEIQDLQPGTLVKSVALEATMKNGLAVLFGGSTFRGAIEIGHLGALWRPDESNHHQQDNGSSSKWKQFFRKNPSFSARILAVDPKTKIIRLTMLPHLMQLKAPSCDTLPQAGDIVEDCAVVKLDPGVGALLAYPDPVDEDLPAKPIDENDESYMEATRVRGVYVHISKAIDADNSKNGRVSQDTFSKKFALNSKHTVRVLQTSNLVDGVASGATAPSIVNAHVMSLADLEPGTLYKQLLIVAKLKGGSVITEFGNGVRGLIPPDHMFDDVVQTSNVREKVREAKFAVGSKVDARVLTVDVAANRLILTAKKSLVKAADEEVVSKYEDIKQGQIVVGFVSKVDNGGLYVSLFNNIYGRVTARSLTAELGIDSPSDSYRRGDVLRCRVVYIKQRDHAHHHDEMGLDSAVEKRYELRLSLFIENTAAPMEVDTPTNDSPAALQVSKILPAKSMRVVELCPVHKHGKFLMPGYAIVAIKAKHILGEGHLEGAPELIECKLPFDQLLDEYSGDCGENLEFFDEAAHEILTKGQKIKRKGLVLIDPKKRVKDYTEGLGDLAIVTIKPEIIDAVENQPDEPGDSDLIFPGPGCHLFEGALIIGQVRRVDARHGAFVHFKDNWRGLYPKSKGGLLLRKYNTIKAKVLVIDHKFSPPKILLGPISDEVPNESHPINKEIIPVAKVTNVDFNWLHISWKDGDEEVSSRIHCSQFSVEKEQVLPPGGCHTRVISSCHPFWGLSKGDEVTNLKIVKMGAAAKSAPIELASVSAPAPSNYNSLSVGDKLSGIIVDSNKQSGLVLRISSTCIGLVPWLELSDDPAILSNATAHFPIGSRLHCVLNKAPKPNGDVSKLRDGLQLSVLRMQDEKLGRSNPTPGDLVVGSIDRSTSRIIRPPELLLKLRNGKIGRCCITELEEMDEWTNFPLGCGRDDVTNGSLQTRFQDNEFVLCRVLQKIPGSPAVEVSLRPSRIQGDVEPDEKPLPGSLVPGYVIETNKKGCFVRLGRDIEARATLKELCDGFIADPSASFPPGRLIAAKVKDVRTNPGAKRGVRCTADIDMRESKLGDGETITFDDLKVGSGHDGIISRTESYGVFVSIEHSDVTVFVHRSECSDKRISDASNHFRPGDHVKVVLIGIDSDKKRVNATMKVKEDENESGSDGESDVDVQAMDIEDAEQIGEEDSNDGSDESDDGSDESESKASSNDDMDSEDEDDRTDNAHGVALDTNVGFDFAGATILEKNQTEDGSDSESSDSDEEDDGNEKKTSKRSRKKQAERRKLEQTIASREAALADGTADENPETAADFERLLASQPNSSELWIRFMAFHLGLADVPAARSIAERAFDRIEFRLETEKLNVWCALLTLEMKFGDETSLNAAKERACRHNNPKHVHLRMCEMYEKMIDENPSVAATAKADEMFETTCKKFKDKKKVWIAYFEYLLKSGRQEEAFQQSKRSLLSLQPYKHVETMSKLSQLMFQYGSIEKARTIFEGLLRTHPKRLDIFFVYADKEIKHGDKDVARSLFAKVANKRDTTLSLKLSDKQMKRFFKKWFAFEETFGTDETREAVKDAARRYVQE